MLDGRPRIEHLREALETWLSDQSAGAQYSLLSVRHASDIEERLPYPATARQVSAAAAQIAPWGATDLAASIEAAAHFASSTAASNGEPYAKLLVVTDGDDVTTLLSPRLPVLPDNVLFTSISIPATSPASSRRLLDLLAERYGMPRARAVPVPDRTPRESESPADPPSDASPQAPVAVAHPEPSGSAGSHAAPEGLIVRWARFARWAFVAFVLLGAAGVAKASSTHRRRVRQVEEHNARPPLMRLEIRGPSGRGEVVIDRYPMATGAGSAAIDHPDCTALQTRVTFTTRGGSVMMSCEQRVTVNGAGRYTHEVADGDQIRIGQVRLSVAGISRPKPIRHPRPRHRRYPIAPAAAAAAATFAFVIVPSELPAVRSIDAHDTGHVPAVAGPAVAGRAVAGPAMGAEAPVVAAAPREPESEQGLVPRMLPPDHLPALRLPVVIEPSDPLPDVTLDYVAFHAHPDDESLDFGALLSRLHHEGLAGAVVVMTDGESGRDQFPWRDISGRYPDHPLTGPSLARVRIEETREAIGWIGASYYLRIGLPNFPYNSIRDELSAAQVIDRWGGRADLVGRVASIIEHFRPRIVISPSEPGPAYEHFEHQATGILVAAAVDRLARSGVSPVQVHFIAVDARQPGGYDDLIAVSPWVPSLDGSIPRLRQLLALRAHRTQRDATVVGVETRLALPYDYFVVRTDDESIIAELLGAALVSGQPRNR